MIYFFAYFWTTVQFKPKDTSEQLRDHGSFIPGLRPGKRTADYLERVMERITYCGAAFPVGGGGAADGGGVGDEYSVQHLGVPWRNGIADRGVGGVGPGAADRVEPGDA